MLITGLVLLAALWRLWLSTRFFGWEESDYGNLAMVQGVLASGFMEHELDHMPLYYALSAAFMAVLGDAMISAQAVSMLGGLVALGIAVDLSDRVFGRSVAIVAGLMLIIQPEFALYSASSLREPLCSAMIMICLWGLLNNKAWLAGVGAASAFLIRFDAAASLGLVLAFWVARRTERIRHRVVALIPLVVTILLWALYYQFREGTWEFWAHAAQRNVDTGLGEEAHGALGWWQRGLGVAWALVTELLPSRVGWAIFVGGIFGCVSRLLTGPELKRLWSFMAISLVGCWAGIGFVAQHDPTHNLYWKWLCPFIPVIIPLGVAQLFQWAHRLVPLGWLGANMLLGLGLAHSVWMCFSESERQIERSAVLYGPQLELARWIEAEVPESVPVLVDNIPGRYLSRRKHGRPLYGWMEMEIGPDLHTVTPDGTEPGFREWLKKSEVGYVFWLQEEWTERPVSHHFYAPVGGCSFHRSMFNHVLNQPDCFNPNDTHTIQFDQWLAYFGDTSGADIGTSPSAVVRQSYQRIDTDQDGVVSWSEFQAVDEGDIQQWNQAPCSEGGHWTYDGVHLSELYRDEFCGGTALESIGEVPYCWVFYEVNELGQ